MASSPAETGGIAVAIPTLNEAAKIADVLASLRIDLPIDRAVRFYVLDGGSSDGTQAIVSAIAAFDARVQLVANPAKLQSAAVNLAAEIAAGSADFLVRCDAHAGYPPGFVRQVVDALERSGADSVVVPMDSVGTTCAGNGIAWVSDTPAGSGGSAHRGGTRSAFVDHGHHAGWRMDSFRRIGGYDPSFSHNEDAELDCRLGAAGGRIWLDADIRITYFVRSSLAGLWRQYRNYGRGRSRTIRRHPGSWRLRQLAVPAFVGANALALVCAAWLPWALLLPLIYAVGLAAISLQVAWRRASRCGLLAGPAACVMHIAWAIGFFDGMVTLRERPWVAASGPPLWQNA